MSRSRPGHQAHVNWRASAQVRRQLGLRPGPMTVAEGDRFRLGLGEATDSVPRVASDLRRFASLCSAAKANRRALVMVDGGSQRIGFLADGDPNTELMSAIYEYDETGVRLHVPFLAHADPRARWWASGMYMDDPDRTKYSYAPPAELNYFDAQGRVGLIACDRGPSTNNLGLGVGRGTVRARATRWRKHTMRPTTFGSTG